MRAFVQRWLGRPAARLQAEGLEARDVPALTSDVLGLASFTTNNQFETATASSASGFAVAVWTTRFNSTDTDISAQLFNPDGSYLGGEIGVTFSSRNESAPTVSMDADGNWTVAWVDQVSGTNTDILAARFDNTGGRLTPDLRIATGPRNEYDPSIGVDAGGNFVVAYTFDETTADQDVLASRFAADGTFLGRIRVSTGNADETVPSVAVSQGADGRFAVAYDIGADVLMKRYTAAGDLMGLHFIGSGPLQQTNPSVAIDNIGRTVTTWQEFNGTWDVLARRVTSTGGRNATVTISATTDQETLPVAAMDRTDADFVIGWQAGTQAFVREMNTNSTPKGGAILVTTNGTAPGISIDGSDFYFVTFTSSNRSSFDPGLGAYGRFGQLV